MGELGSWDAGEAGNGVVPCVCSVFVLNKKAVGNVELEEFGENPSRVRKESGKMAKKREIGNFEI